MKRGPRFTEESNEDTARRLTDVAVRIVAENGLAGLSFRTLAAAPELRLAPTAALHYFGTYAGLLGAIAEHGFNELAAELQRVREAPGAPLDSLKAVAAAHGRYALEKPHLYEAIHSSRLWEAVGRTTPSLRATDKAQPWLKRAIEARGYAFGQYVLAVANAQRVGVIIPEPKDKVAHVLTTLVDGFLFQVLVEKIMPDIGIDEQADYLDELIELTINGLRAAAH